MRSVTIAVAVLAAAPVLAQPASPKFAGSRVGTLKQGADEMEITVNIAPADTAPIAPG
jgi:hypothetical protein